MSANHTWIQQRPNSLFTLSTGSEAQQVIDQIKDNMDQGGNSPLYQGSGPNSVDFKQWVLKAPKK